MKTMFLAAAAATVLLAGCATKENASTECVGADCGGSKTWQQQIVDAAGSDTVFFGTDRYDLNAETAATLKGQAAFLAANPTVGVTIEGHCDERGTREYNMALGERRANAVRRYLVANGVAADRIKTVSYGKERPVANGHDDAAWAQNRRAVSIVIAP